MRAHVAARAPFCLTLAERGSLNRTMIAESYMSLESDYGLSACIVSIDGIGHVLRNKSARMSNDTWGTGD